RASTSPTRCPTTNMRAISFVALTALGCVSAFAQPKATDVTDAEIKAILKKTASQAVNDTQLKIVDIDGQYNVGVGIIHRARPAEGKTLAPSSLSHSEVTEIYHFIEGTATMVTGGAMDNAKESAPDSSLVKVLAGPGQGGGAIQGGVSRKVG